MKITTWNVNGLRAALNKGVWTWVQQHNPDVLCLQEIKSRSDQIPSNYHDQFKVPYIYWNPAERPGYSGVATFCNLRPLSVAYGVGCNEFDLEGRVIRTQFPNFSLFNVYFPSGQRGLDRVEFKLRFYAQLLEICDAMHVSNEKS